MPQDGRTPGPGCITSVLVTVTLFGVAVFWWNTRDTSAPNGTASPTTEHVVVDTTEAPSERAVETGAPVAADAAAYTISYRVELFSGDAVLVDTETRRYSAPFQASVLIHQGDTDAGGEPSERTTQVMGGFETGSPDQDPVLFTVLPGVPVRLGHFGGDLASAVDHGTMAFTGRRLTIARRDCDVYRTLSPLDMVELQPATDDDYTDVCIAPDGLVLREEWHTGGQLLRRRTAQAVKPGPVPDDAFEVEGYRIPDRQGGGRLRQIRPDSTAPGVDHFLPSEIPEPFTSIGRFVFVGDQADSGASLVETDRAVSLVDVFVAGHQLIVIENGGGLFGAAFTPPENGVPVDLPVGQARAVVRANQNELSFPGEGSRFLRITSTLPLAQLIAIAQQIAPVAGTGEVTPIDDEIDVTGRAAPDDVTGDNSGS